MPHSKLEKLVTENRVTTQTTQVYDVNNGQSKALT